MRRRSERKKSSSPAPVPVAVARRSRRSRKVSENEKTEDEAPVAGQKDIPDTDVPELPQASVAREEINEARASSEERAGSGSSPVRKSRGSRTTPKKRTEAKGGDKKVDTIPEEEPENGQDAVKEGVEEEKAVEPPAALESESEDIAKKEDQLAPVEESEPEAGRRSPLATSDLLANTLDRGWPAKYLPVWRPSAPWPVPWPAQGSPWPRGTSPAAKKAINIMDNGQLT